MLFFHLVNIILMLNLIQMDALIELRDPYLKNNNQQKKFQFLKFKQNIDTIKNFALIEIKANTTNLKPIKIFKIETNFVFNYV